MYGMYLSRYLIRARFACVYPAPLKTARKIIHQLAKGSGFGCLPGPSAGRRR
ncbi:hypothetical protein HMPREF0742_02553 [Rothia aeria F0184]|uniref:Uncharacterized protein n=1 Tax=Rothia aeria F0184 TaxID=888019 RepID=U7UWP6_9MICC|nr:hypothetical protein HMPREF0742_02553 [Rothia aeria F0184]